VTVQIANQHLESEVTRPVKLVVEGEIVDKVDVTVAPDSATQETLTWTTTDVDVDRYTLLAQSGRNADTAEVRIGCIPRREAGRDTPEDLICEGDRDKGRRDDDEGDDDRDRGRGDDNDGSDDRDRGRDDEEDDESDRDQGR
jgi:hypothetical protein